MQRLASDRLWRYGGEKKDGLLPTESSLPREEGTGNTITQKWAAGGGGAGGASWAGLGVCILGVYKLQEKGPWNGKWEKLHFPLTSNCNLAFPLIMNVGDKPKWFRSASVLTPMETTGIFVLYCGCCRCAEIVTLVTNWKLWYEKSLCQSLLFNVLIKKHIYY